MNVAYGVDALNVTDDNYLVINSSSDYRGGVSVGTGGITVSDSILAGVISDANNGNIYVEPSAFIDGGAYTFQSAGDIDITNFLTLADGFSLNMTGDASPVNVIIGTIKNGDTGSITKNRLSFDNINNLTVGTVQNLNGVTYVNALGNISVGKSDSYGMLQNLASKVELHAGGDIDVFGTIEGSNTNGDIVIHSGRNFTVYGGAANSASIINKGNLLAEIAGTTTLAHGFDLTGMDAANVFDFTTGNLIIGDGEPYSWVNDVDTFKLTLTDSDAVLNAGNIQNGVNNTNAKMSIAAATINAQNIKNNAQDLLLSASTDINLTGNIETNTGNTEVYASGKINAAETSVVNKATARIVGTDGVVIKSLSNTGGNLDVSTNTAANHTLAIVSDVVNNSGQIRIEGNKIDIGGLLSYGEVDTDSVTVHGTGAVSFGNVDVKGGTFNLDALAGSVTSGSGLNVTDGTLNFGASLTQLNVAGDVNIAGQVTLSGANAGSAGDVNISAYGNTSTSIISGGSINISRGVSAVANDLARLAKFDSDNITIGTAGIVASNKGAVVLGNTTTGSALNVSGEISATNGGSVDIYSKYVTARLLDVNNGALVVRGESVVANNGINIANGLWFDTLKHDKGLSVLDTHNIELRTDSNTDIIIGGGIGVTAGNTIKLVSGQDINVTGLVDVSGKMDIVADNLSAGNDITVIGGGNVTVSAATMGVSGFVVQNDANAELNVANSVSISDLRIDGNLYQGAYSGTNGLWLLGDAAVSVTDVAVTGDFIAGAGNVVYHIADTFNIAGGINVYSDAQVLLDVDNIISVKNLADLGKLALSGSDTIIVENSADISGVMYQNKDEILDNTYMNIISDNYTFTAGNFESGGIYQDSGKMWVDSGNVIIAGDVIAHGDELILGSDEQFLMAAVDGSVSGNIHFKDLQRLYVGQKFVFGNNSVVEAMILPNREMSGSYWAHVDSEGKMVNADDGMPLIAVGQNFVFDFGDGLLDDNQIHLTMFDIADTDEAIWLVSALNGIKNLDGTISNFVVKYCNADGSICVDYPDVGYLVRRNMDIDNVFHDLYLTFDPSLGLGYVHKIQPFVDVVPGHTDSAYFAAGAIDDLIAHQLEAKGFYNKTPIEVLPRIFANTKMYDMASALADRMAVFTDSRDEHIYESFSRLFEARDAEQLLGNIALNEHTYFRNFEDRMIDEFLWNRNRNLNKAWLDVDYGLFTQKTSEDVDADGNRFGISAGFDWQQAKSLILGLTAHFNHLKSDANDTFNVGYLPSEEINGFVDTSVTDNNFGLGAYLMQNLGQGARLYGNAFMDLHVLDVDRKQNYVSDISGDGIAFSVISEWGLLHDWLNQYITGNLYARVGYNTGFNITEKTAGADYMDLKSGGYGILTPGYTLTAQKRIYPSSWFQIRPYVSVGAEYDVLGVPDQIKYKFAVVDNWTDYDVDINPLWINGGLGVELVSATGLQVGLDYRYQHNSDIQLHNFKLSGSYRF
ncbi:MAG: hypothetical protein KBS86_01450 [Proteobacteria bacterium]|nr:hypothetical protein [Candidatus Enterousia scatequi]